MIKFPKVGFERSLDARKEAAEYSRLFSSVRARPFLKDPFQWLPIEELFNGFQ
jgi:hypothetical protein